MCPLSADPLKRPPALYKTCQRCGKNFCNVRTSKSGRIYQYGKASWAAQKFCSSQCIAYREPQFKTCLVCDVRFSNQRKFNVSPGKGTVDAKKWAKAQWCSKKCRWITQKAKQFEKECAQCGAIFTNELKGKQYKKGQVCNSKRFAAQKCCSNVCGLRYRQQRTAMQAFWDNVAVLPASKCWPWLGHRAQSGHGRIVLKDIGGRSILAHRLSYALFNGRIPGKRIVCHDCGNASCVNPAHLYLGDYMTNAADRFARARPKPLDIALPHADVWVNSDGRLQVQKLKNQGPIIGEG